jgi:polysaccharide biosynthesis protein PslH
VKVLFLTPYAPFPPRGGGEQRMYQMLRLVAQQHEVHLLTFATDDAAERGLDPLRAHCRVHAVRAPKHTVGRRVRTLFGSTMPDMALRGHDATYARALAQLLQDVRFDVVQAESIEMAQYGCAEQGAKRRPLWVYDAFNAEYLLQRRALFTDMRRVRRLGAAAYSLVQWWKLRRYEGRLAQRFDLLLAVSSADQRHLAQLAPALPSAVVPNGVDTTFFRPLSAINAAAPPVALFTGTLDFRPNVDALGWFVRDVWPVLRARRPDLELCVVGQRPVPAVQELGGVEGVHIVGAVEDVRSWFGRATVYVLPMRVGGGVRLKLLETWAMGVPCVSTSLGVEGIPEFEPGEHALVADDVPAFVHAVERLLDDGALRDALRQRARTLAESYDWRPIVERMVQSWHAHMRM